MPCIIDNRKEKLADYYIGDAPLNKKRFNPSEIGRNFTPMK